MRLLAQAQKLVSAGFAGTTAAVGTGSLTFDFGTVDAGNFTSNGNGAKTVTITAGNNTLAGVRDAVNAAKIGVTATIVNDGGTNGYRLVFTSDATGAANSLKITVADDDSTNGNASGLSRLAYDPAGSADAGRNLEEKVLAQDAFIKVDGIEMHKASNTVTDAIQGVTLTLTKTNVDAPTTLTVATNSASTGAAIAAFVKAYNDLDTTFDNLTKYNADTKQASVLTGDGTVRRIQSQLRGLLGGTLGAGAYSTLSQVGLSFQADGTLKLDNTKLTNAISANPSAVTQLFAAMGTTSDSLVSVAAFTKKTTSGTYSLDVTQVARQAQVVGDGAAVLAVTAGVDDALDLVVDGIAGSIKLQPAGYADAAALAADLQSKINALSVFSDAGAKVSVTQAAGTLTITSERYGTASSVSLGGLAAANLFGAAPTSTSGADAAATLGGQALVGTGQLLKGPVDTPLEGLQVQVSGGATGSRGTVTYQTGFAYQLNELVKQVVGSDGAVAARTDGLQRDLKGLTQQQDALNRRLAQVQKNYLAQFNALDTLLSNLNSQSTALAQQLATLPTTSSSR